MRDDLRRGMGSRRLLSLAGEGNQKLRGGNVRNRFDAGDHRCIRVVLDGAGMVGPSEQYLSQLDHDGLRWRRADAVEPRRAGVEVATMRTTRIGAIAALSMAAAMMQGASESLYGLRDGRVEPRAVYAERPRQSAQWKRETGQVRRKGRQ